MKSLEQLVSDLNSFDPLVRKNALRLLADSRAAAFPVEGVNLNMHFHSFFSYNAKSYSPSRIVWEAKNVGLFAAGLCDFDVLDGLEEFLDAGRMLELRVAVALETRVYLEEYADVEISSPGEPGVTYIMGAGFARELVGGSKQAAGLADYKIRAGQRNKALIDRINARLPTIALDYEKDVLPLTPAGGATERHIVTAYINKARTVAKNAEEFISLWSSVLGENSTNMEKLMANQPAFEEAVRKKLAKRGGLGYIQPSIGAFPPAQDFIDWVLSCDAIPMITWLDGTSDGEKDGCAMLECMRDKGAAALNIIPDRNWNVSDPKEAARKVSLLDDIVTTAESMDLPINIGTEMNKQGLPFVDSLTCKALQPYRDTFTRGAAVMVGHTVLLRYADYSYIGRKAKNDIGRLSDRNKFFETIGRLAPLNESQAKRLEDMGTEKALDWFRNISRREAKI
ncbi:MAG: hypothetical protein JXN60_04575 [Lentisphaerae bacterium]|nr:hypothetical protein [Lentisphaerota bacterium]